MVDKLKTNSDDSDTLRAILGELRELNRQVTALVERLPPGTEPEADLGRDPGYDPERDPGSVPPGVAPFTPAPQTAEDKKARRALERLSASSRSRAK